MAGRGTHRKTDRQTPADKRKVISIIPHLIKLRLFAFGVVEIFNLSSAGVILFPFQKPALFVARLSLGAFVAKHFDLRVGAVQRNAAVGVGRVGVDLQVHRASLYEEMREILR